MSGLPCAIRVKSIYAVHGIAESRWSSCFLQSFPVLVALCICVLLWPPIVVPRSSGPGFVTGSPSPFRFGRFPIAVRPPYLATLCLLFEVRDTRRPHLLFFLVCLPWVCCMCSLSLFLLGMAGIFFHALGLHLGAPDGLIASRDLV